MKKILLSLVAIAAVAGVVTGVTIAFYNDTETSAGNIFVAGSVDLKVDHTKQTYNGVDCKTCAVTVVSDTSNMVVAKNDILLTTSTSAMALSWIHPAWTAAIPGAVWIWVTNPVTQEDVTNNVRYTFRKTFSWLGPISGATLNLGVSADNSYEVWINGIMVGADTAANNFASVDTIVNIDDNIIQGLNIIEFKVKNWAQPGGSPGSNPAGLLYKLTIDGNCGDAYFQNHCSLWQETDLTGQQFFNFDDIKPGDFGTDVISLHVYGNNAYSCLIVGDQEDNENTIYESETGDTSDPQGELSQYMDVFTWGDDGDGLYEPTGETPLVSGPLSTLTSLMSLDSGNSQFLTATTTEYIGLAWCAGTLTVDENGVFNCDGAGMPNDAQSDSFSATLTAYAEQVRNNGSFLCSEVDLNPESSN